MNSKIFSIALATLTISVSAPSAIASEWRTVSRSAPVRGNTQEQAMKACSALARQQNLVGTSVDYLRPDSVYRNGKHQPNGHLWRCNMSGLVQVSGALDRFTVGR